MTAPSRLYRFLAEFREYCRTRSATEFSPSERLTCRAILDHFDNQTLSCWVSNRRIAEIAGQGENTVRRNVSAIERHGILTKVPGRPGRGLANRYRGQLGFSEKTVPTGPFASERKRSESDAKTVGARPRTVKNKLACSAQAPEGASPAALDDRQAALLARLDAIKAAARDGRYAAYAFMSSEWPDGVPRTRLAHKWTDNDTERLEPIVTEAEAYL